MIYQGKRRYAVNEIVFHASATNPNWMAGRRTSEKLAEIRRWHVEERGWRDVGYHYAIDRDGTILRGRPIDQIGAHVKGRNRGTVGAVLLGGRGGSSDDLFSDHFTAAQDRAARGLIAKLSGLTAIKRISGHNEFAAKACPCFEVSKWLHS